MKTHNANAIKPQNQAEFGQENAELCGQENAELELTEEEMMKICGGRGLSLEVLLLQLQFAAGK